MTGSTHSADGPLEPDDFSDPTLGRPVEGAPDAPPRLLPDVPFPPYRFVPGKAPHPFAHEGGWGHGSTRTPPPFLERDAWRDNRAYLSGLDFFNRGWWWEAHEAWEELWHVVEGQDVVQHDLLKGLIQLAACALNRERASDTGAARLLGSAGDLIERARDAAGAEVVMGLELAAVRRLAVEKLGEPAAWVEGLYLWPSGNRHGR